VALNRVTLIIPLYNGRRFIRQAVESVLTEESSIEILVVDDGSTDGGARELRDLPLTLVSHPKRRGVAAARNTGLGRASGQFITFLDADDILVRGGIDWRLAWLEKNPEVPVVAGRPESIIDAQAILSLDFYRKGGNYPVGCWNFMYHRDWFSTVGGFDESLSIGEDLDFLLRTLERTLVPVVSKPVIRRRLHEANLSVVADRTSYRLTDATIEACQGVLERYDISVSNWTMWEASYGLEEDCGSTSRRLSH
jgi:glycosyltransferase involved in cell wall biosynthesis